jgi:hypothetical protein
MDAGIDRKGIFVSIEDYAVFPHLAKINLIGNSDIGESTSPPTVSNLTCISYGRGLELKT